jgi:hypothetical protein
MSFSPEDVANTIKYHLPEFEVSYAPDFRQQIADGWPKSIDDREARMDWEWQHQFDLDRMATEMLKNLRAKLAVASK